MSDRCNWLLIIQLAIVVLVLGKLIILPTKASKSRITPLVFPTHIPLQKWQQTETKALSGRTIPDSKYFIGDNLGGQSYSYIHQDRALEIKARYLVNTNGDLKSYVKQYTGAIAPFLREQEQIGSYVIYPYKDAVYLTACINPYGETSVTSDRFRHNSLRHSLNLIRIWRWLTSQNGVIDSRCLWVYLSMPLDNNSPEAVYPLLEAAWFDYYQWWAQNYPPD